MGAVTVVVLGRCFPVDQIPKSHDAVFRQNKIFHRRDPRIQKSDGEPSPGRFRRKKVFHQRHGKHLLSLLKYVKKHFWGLWGIPLF